MGDGLLIALGGHALFPADGGAGTGVAAQRAHLARALAGVAALAARDGPLVVTHGNGPQVGHALARAEAARDRAYPLSLDVCVAQTQGECGYLVAATLARLLARAGHPRPVVAIVTRVLVDPRDPRLAVPTKPVGPVLAPDAAPPYPVRDDPGRGRRRVVPSPLPVGVVEEDAIRRLRDAGTVVVAGGGGGIAVPAPGDDGTGLEAVVDKDWTSAVLAHALGIPRILHLTAVDHVRLDFGTPRARDLTRLGASDARRHLADGQFADGTMGPKVASALWFLERGGHAVDVATPAHAVEASAGRAGTRIEPDARDGEDAP